jgi:hypothetical protein
MCILIISNFNRFQPFHISSTPYCQKGYFLDCQKVYFLAVDVQGGCRARRLSKIQMLHLRTWFGWNRVAPGTTVDPEAPTNQRSVPGTASVSQCHWQWPGPPWQRTCSEFPRRTSNQLLRTGGRSESAGLQNQLFGSFTYDSMISRPNHPIPGTRAQTREGNADYGWAKESQC